MMDSLKYENRRLKSQHEGQWMLPLMVTILLVAFNDVRTYHYYKVNYKAVYRIALTTHVLLNIDAHDI